MLRPIPLTALVASGTFVLLSLGTVYNQPQSLSQIIPGQSCSSCAGSTKDNTDAYHRLLSNVRPIDNYAHSRTLGVFSDIFVVTLERRLDRRMQMDRLARALRADFTYAPAVDANDALVTQLLERVRYTREVALAVGTKFNMPSTRNVENQEPFELKGADTWTLDPADPRSPKRLPDPPSPDPRPVLECTTSDMNFATPGKGMVLTRPRVATWASHIALLRRIAEQPNANYSALIIEDDVDVEWDIEHRLRGMWPALPKDWEMVFLGYCFSPETNNKAIEGAPNLRPSHFPLCTHAYAMSRNGARRVLHMMRYELFAYSRPIDNAYRHLIQMRRVKSYSVVPPIVSQRKDNWSDVLKKNETQKMDSLVDSTVDRIALVDALEAERK